MKIFEIIEPRTIEKIRQQPFDKNRVELQNLIHQEKYGKDDPNRGFYAKGRPSIHDPFMYTKISAQPVNLEDDGYFNYVQAIKPYIQSNPYLPRVYVIKIDKDSEGKAVPKYQMEKLFNLRELDKNDLDTRDEILRPISEKIFFEPPENPKGLFYRIGRALNFGEYDEIKDKKLIQALELIREVNKNDNFEFDLHRNNFLYRRGPYGIQLVIADPLAG